MKYSTSLSIVLTLLIMPFMSSQAFDSGSTGVDGAFNPTTNTTLTLPTNGIFNFTEINIPAGVTVTFEKNATNTPVILLASGDITIAGTVSVSGAASPDVSDEDKSNDGQPGLGGPGGFDGGIGGFLNTPNTNNVAGRGKGPGGGEFGVGLIKSLWDGSTINSGCGGGGGGHTTTGGAAQQTNNGRNVTCIEPAVQGGASYGVEHLIPLLGGSGGGGGASGAQSRGAGGGGGGGAILIAVTGTFTLVDTGRIRAAGGDSGGNGNILSGNERGGLGGGGSGGAIRIIATTITGEGILTARSGLAQNTNGMFGGTGSVGRIRLEAEQVPITPSSDPAFSFAAPNPIFVSNLPAIQITSVAGIAAPTAPTGDNDVVLPENTPNPVDVNFATTDIPAGGVILLTAVPSTGDAVSSTSTPIAANGTATASIDLPNGPSVLIATTTFTVTAALGADYSKYAQGEQVEHVKVTMNEQGQSETTFITVSGKAFTWPSNAVTFN